jgi:hypothetical protein
MKVTLELNATLFGFGIYLKKLPLRERYIYKFVIHATFLELALKLRRYGNKS